MIEIKHEKILANQLTLGMLSLSWSLQKSVSLKNTKCVGAEPLLQGSDQSGSALQPNIIVVLNNPGKGKLFTHG